MSGLNGLATWFSISDSLSRCDVSTRRRVGRRAGFGPLLERTGKVAQEAGVGDVVEPIEGEMEAIPLPDRSVDVIVSNGVINLSPRKARVFAECARVRAGGRFCVSDITIVEEQLPPEVLVHPAARAG
jgi:arsenite methyltransferase